MSQEVFNPAGAGATATAANQATEITALGTLHTDVGTTIHADVTSTNTKLDTLHTDNGTLATAIGLTSTAANQTTANTKLDTLHTDVGTTIHADVTSSNTKLDTVHTDLTSTNTKLDTLHTDNGTLATAISPLATSALQTTANTKLDTLHTDMGTLHTDNTTLGTLIGGTLITQRPSLGTPGTPAILTSTGDIIAANASRKYFYVQNLSTNTLFVRLGTGASSTVFHKILKGSAVASDGSGGDFVEDQFRGIVSIAGTSPSYIAWETT